MKAREYVDKYGEAIWTETGVNAARAMYLELCDEALDLVKKRNIKCISAKISIIKEINQKWNAIGNLLEKKYGRPILVRDGYIILWEKKNLNFMSMQDTNLNLFITR